MFDLVHKHKLLVQMMLALITLPFAFWGIDSYRRGASTAQDVAEVAGQKITLQDFSQAQRDQQERLRARARAAISIPRCWIRRRSAPSFSTS